MFPLSSNLLFKFEFTPDSTNPGNNIFIDDINVGSTTDIGVVQRSNVNWTIFPNPAGETIQIEYFLHEAQNISIEILDVTGKIVTSIPPKRVEPGIHKESLTMNNYSRGLYFVKLSGENLSNVKKLILE
jgi:hypothetical protein